MVPQNCHPDRSVAQWRDLLFLFRFSLRLTFTASCSLGHLVHFEIALRRNTEGVRHAIEKGKQRGDVYRFGNLGLAPTVMAQDLHVFRGGAIRRLGHLGDIFKQRAMRIVELRPFEVARRQRLDCLLFCSLNPQEVSMRIQSIGTTIEPGDPAGDRFLGPAREVPFRKVDRIAEAHDLAQEIRPMAKALENAGHLLAPRMGAPLVIYRRNLASRVSVLDQLYFCLGVRHSSGGQRVAQT
jgi:hypothetical protein